MRFMPLEQKSFPCGYFDDRDAIYEHYLVIEGSDEERELLLEQGYRSFGKYYFRPACEGCQRCVPLRVPLHAFHASKSQRRIINRCADIEVKVSRPVYTQEKFDIYLDHGQRFKRGYQSTEKEFEQSFYDQESKALEFSYYLENRLIAVGIVNETETTLSSVYFFYRLEHARLSLGTFGVLQEIEYGLQNDKHFLYLGYWIEDNHFMRYKAAFRPNEILGSNGKWQPFRDAGGAYMQDPATRFQPFPTSLSQYR